MDEYRYPFKPHTDKNKTIQQHLIDETGRIIDEIKSEGVSLDGLLWVTYVMTDEPYIMTDEPYMIVIRYPEEDVVSDLCHDWDGKRPKGVSVKLLREKAMNIQSAGLGFFHTGNPRDDAAINDKLLRGLMDDEGFRLMQMSGSKKEIRRFFPLMVSSNVALEDMKEGRSMEVMEVSSQQSDSSVGTHTSTMSRHLKLVSEKALEALEAEKKSSRAELNLDYTLEELQKKSADWLPETTSSSSFTLAQIAERVRNAGVEFIKDFNTHKTGNDATYPVRNMPDQGVGGFEVLNEESANIWLSKQFDTGTADTESADTEFADPEAYEKNKNINVCFHTGLFLLKKGRPFAETPKIIIIPSQSILRSYMTTTHFFEGLNETHHAVNLRASIHDLAQLVVGNHINELHAVMLKFMADRFCIQNHLFQLFGIIDNTVQYLPITHDGRAFLNNILIALFNFVRKQFENIRIPGAFARTTKRTSDKDGGYTVLIAVPDFRVLTEYEKQQRLRVAEAIEKRDAERKRKKEEEEEKRRVNKNKEKDKRMKKIKKWKEKVDNEYTRIENQIRSSEFSARPLRIIISSEITTLEQLLSTEPPQDPAEIILINDIQILINHIKTKIDEYKKKNLEKKTDGGRKIQTRYIKTRKNTTIAKLYNKHSKKTKKYRK